MSICARSHELYQQPLSLNERLNSTFILISYFTDHYDRESRLHNIFLYYFVCSE